MSDTATGAADGDRSRALWSSTAAFTACFAVWTTFSIIGVQIKKDLGLNDTQFGLLVGTPILTGGLIRLVLGIWTDQYGGRFVYAGVMVSEAIATFLLTFAHDYPTFLLAALGVGISGGSFAVGIAYVSRWYPKEKQGTALDIFGAGNVGAAMTKFLAPVVMIAFGWKTVAEIWALGLIVRLAEQTAVLASLRHLATCPFVAERVVTGGLALHGWYFHFGWGVLQAATGPRGPLWQVDAHGPLPAALGAGAQLSEAYA